MPVTAWTSPGTVTGTNWSATDAGTLVNSVATNDNVYALHTGAIGTEYLIMRNFGFSLPTGAIVEGIEWRSESYYYDGAISGGTFVYTGFKLFKDGSTLEGTEHEYSVQTYPPGSPSADETLGGSTDMWGVTLTEAEVEDANFGIALKAGASTTNIAPNNTRGRALDHGEMRVHYSEAITPPPVVLTALGDMDHYPGYGIIRPDLEVRF